MHRPIGENVTVKQLQDEHDEFSSLEPPIRRVPGEIMVSIIHWDIGGPGHFVGATERETFLRLRQVSTLWRRTAFSTPYLWRYLRVDVDTSADEDLHSATARFQRLIPQWFERAGRDAEVHLAFGGRTNSDGQPIDGIGVAWRSKERSYRLTTAVLWGDVFLGSCGSHFWTSHVTNLSIPGELVLASPGHPLSLSSRFPAPKSLVLGGHPEIYPFLNNVNHPSLSSLLLSRLTIVPSDLTMSIRMLPRLEELIIHNSVFTPGGDEIQTTVHSSIERLICSHVILFRWPKILFPSLKFFKLVRNDFDQQDCKQEDLEYRLGTEDDTVLPTSGSAF
ncbi:hypothetical protein BKA70DRAFT_518151 [Coprinopsis sp. MPI-PUGE-AT-0042]|nr:hypothetical protein BKA70DRAFT_518151 [Coprinopsis sp. MPI-PUGE-AT-0042]